MTFGEVPIATWFVSERDANLGPLFKWDDRVAEDRQGKKHRISESDQVLVVRFPLQPGTEP